MQAKPAVKSVIWRPRHQGGLVRPQTVASLGFLGGRPPGVGDVPEEVSVQDVRPLAAFPPDGACTDPVGVWDPRSASDLCCGARRCPRRLECSGRGRSPGVQPRLAPSRDSGHRRHPAECCVDDLLPAGDPLQPQRLQGGLAGCCHTLSCQALPQVAGKEAASVLELDSPDAPHPEPSPGVPQPGRGPCPKPGSPGPQGPGTGGLGSLQAVRLLPSGRGLRGCAWLGGRARAGGRGHTDR